MHHHYCINQATDRADHDQANSHNFIISQLDLGLDREAGESPQIFDGWAIEPSSKGSDRYPYRIHNLEHGYRLAPPFSENEAIRAIEILGHAADRPDGIAANIAIESTWSVIVGVAK
ncbi:MAG: hypothetical protein HC795_13015 [Coleofasciculaceae cyanobacterium RL_1_1]|nr:hypothetical protein [Coleofasciculaceae cyanobacterium RL_1_1]